MATDVTPLRSLDARYYIDPSIFDLETGGLFAQSWQFAGHASQLQKAGDFFTFEVAGESLFCVMDRDGSIKAFYNVCQHRAHQLVSGTGSAKLITCPYHAWTYELSGQLRAGPNVKSVAGFRREDICLSSVQVENFCGFLFVNLDPQAAPMDDWFPGVRDALQAHVPQIDRLQPLEWVEIPEACNWKVSVENYSECYHCALNHKTFSTGVVRPDHSSRECLVVQCAVIAFGVILHRHFPITGLRDFHPFQRLQPVYLRHMRLQRVAHPRKPVIHRRCLRIQIDKQKATEVFDLHRRQANILAAESGNRFNIRAGAKLAGQLIGPSMVGTGDQLCTASATDQLMRTMLTDIVEGLDAAITIHHAKKGFTSHLEGKEIPGLLKLRCMACKLPALRKETACLQIENRWINVIARIERAERCHIGCHFGVFLYLGQRQNALAAPSSSQ